MHRNLIGLSFWNFLWCSWKLMYHHCLCVYMSVPITHHAPRCIQRCVSPMQEPHGHWLCECVSPPPMERQKPVWCWLSPRPHCLAMETRPSSWPPPPPHHNLDKTSRLQKKTPNQERRDLTNGSISIITAVVEDSAPSCYSRVIHFSCKSGEKTITAGSNQMKEVWLWDIRKLSLHCSQTSKTSKQV